MVSAVHSGKNINGVFYGFKQVAKTMTAETYIQFTLRNFVITIRKFITTAYKQKWCGMTRS